MKQLIIDEINQIKNLEERVVFKELLNGVFLSLYENNQNMYKQLEDRILQEVAYDSNQFSIISGLIERKYFDASHHVFAPMLDKDMENLEFNLGEILESLQKNETIKVMQVFLECDYLKMKEILSSGHKYQGYVKTEKGTYRTEFSLRINNDYVDELYHLYQLFIRNGLPWRTVNMPYAFRMVDIFLEKCGASLNEDIKIKEISVDFQEYSKYIQYEMIPVWNVVKKRVESIGFPMPCEDHKNYKHIIPINDFGPGYAYLVENNDFVVENVQKQEDKLMITCATDNIQKWIIYMIRNGETKKIDRYSYPVLSNVTMNNFAEKLYGKSQMIVKTKGELIRFLENFDLGSYLEFDKYEILNQDKGDLLETYSMNSFIIDEIRQINARKRLVLYMKAKKQDFFLTRDILSFLISEVQQLFPEYCCEGKLI